MNSWEDILTERDKAVFASSGKGQRAGFGMRPVVMIVDVNYNFVGDTPKPILESVKEWRNSCGDEGWTAIEHIRSLLSAARGKHLPVIYSTGHKYRKDRWDCGRWADKNARINEVQGAHRVDGNAIPAEIAPEPDDIVIAKFKPSPFFGTMLAGFLIDLQADSIILGGTTTSGCVRATVIDGFSYNYKMSVVEQCTFDRGQASHKASLFDINEKYGDVVSIDEAVQYINSLPAGLFEKQMPVLKAKT